MKKRIVLLLIGSLTSLIFYGQSCKTYMPTFTTASAPPTQYQNSCSGYSMFYPQGEVKRTKIERDNMVDLNDLNKGIYFITLFRKGQIFHKAKFIKE